VSLYSRRFQIVSAVVIGCLWATPAAAQRATGPFAGLFGGQGAEREQSLDFRGSLFGTYDRDRATGGDPLLADRRFDQSGMLGGVSGGLSYRRHRNRTAVSFDGSGSLLDYTASPGLAGIASANGAVTTAFGQKFAFSTTGGLVYSPFYQFAPFLDAGIGGISPLASGGIPSLTSASFLPTATGGPPLAPGPGLAALSQRNATLFGSLAVTSNYSKKSSLSGDVNWHETRMLDSGTSDLRSWGGHAVFRHHLTRALSFHAGYGRDQIRYSFASSSAPPIYQSLDVGLDYGDALAFARRTSLSFFTTTSAVRYSNRTYYRLGGGAVLTRGLARTWSSTLAYVRGTDFVPGFSQPLLSDSLSAGLGGLIAARVSSFSNVGFSRGSVGFSSTNSNFNSYFVTSGLQAAVTRSMGLFGQYTYYQYQVPAGSSALQLMPHLSRHAVTVGLSMWVPITKQVR
jgi:hypothetical protein